MPCSMVCSLPQRLDWHWALTGLKSLPIASQFVLMQFSPSLDQTNLPLRHSSFDEFNWIDAEDRRVLLVICMKVWRVMSCARLPIHSDYDPIEATQFRHSAFYAKLPSESPR